MSVFTNKMNNFNDDDDNKNDKKCRNKCYKSGAATGDVLQKMCF